MRTPGWWGMMVTRGCASLTPGYKPRLRLGLTCFACHRIQHHVERMQYAPTGGAMPFRVPYISRHTDGGSYSNAPIKPPDVRDSR